MGYYTTYELKWESGDFEKLHKWTELINQVGEEKANVLLDAGLISFEPFTHTDDLIGDWIESNLDYALRRDGSSKGECKWYDHAKDIAKLSEDITDILFTLECSGEDGEHWRVYALNGKTQRANGKVVYPACNLRQ